LGSLDKRTYWRTSSGGLESTLRPRIIRVVTAGNGDSVETMTRRVADVAPRALLLLLNGWSPGHALKPGERVKIVTFAPIPG
jgi:predicted Zn-dependent protease